MSNFRGSLRGVKRDSACCQHICDSLHELDTRQSSNGKKEWIRAWRKLGTFLGVLSKCCHKTVSIIVSSQDNMYRCHHQKGYWRHNPVFFLGPVHIDSFSICVSKFCTPTGKDIFSINHIVRQFGDSELFLSRNGRKFLQI